MLATAAAAAGRQQPQAVPWALVASSDLGGPEPHAVLRSLPMPWTSLEMSLSEVNVAQGWYKLSKGSATASHAQREQKARFLWGNCSP